MKGFNSEKDHVYMMSIGDLGTLSERVDGIVRDATTNGYGETVEAAFYTHGGIHGPIGDLITSGNYNLSQISNDNRDRFQMTETGWSSINWNFDSNNSVASFYGCNTVGFAKSFLGISNVKYSAGQEFQVGPSYSANKFDAVNVFYKYWKTSNNIFYGDNDNGKFSGVSAFGRNIYMDTLHGKMLKPHNVNGNVGVKNGNLYNYK